MEDVLLAMGTRPLGENFRGEDVVTDGASVTALDLGDASAGSAEKTKFGLELLDVVGTNATDNREERDGGG